MKAQKANIATTATPAAADGPVLVVDIGGSSVKCLLEGQSPGCKFASSPALTPQQAVAGVRELTRGWHYSRIALGYPGVVRGGVPVREPHNLGHGWTGFDFGAAFGCPVRVINDAALQALGAYRGGKMLFLGLGTGLGSTLIVDGHVLAMELGHLRWTKKHSCEDMVGKAGYTRMGKQRWRRKVQQVVQALGDALLPDDIVLGGGRAKRLQQLPAKARLGANADAHAGGLRLWHDATLTLG